MFICYMIYNVCLYVHVCMFDVSLQLSGMLASGAFSFDRTPNDNVFYFRLQKSLFEVDVWSHLDGVDG